LRRERGAILPKDIDDRLDKLFHQLAEGRIGGDDAQREIRSLLNLSTHSYQREKLRGALSWSDIYFSPRKWQRWGNQQRVKDFVLADIYKAKGADH
jgi:hypothetical protein